MVNAIEPALSTDEDRPLCKCHDVPMVKHGYYKNGKVFWRCNVVRLAWRHQEEQMEKNRQGARRRWREKYYNDPLWRIAKNLKRSREHRVARLERLKRERGMSG